MKRNWVFLLLPLFITGCLHTVGYKLTNSDRWTGPKINGVVCVQPIADQTVYDIGNWRPEHNDKGDWRTNYRGGYNHTNLTDEVTAMVVKQLAYSGLFTKVVSGKETNVDYVLSGSLTDFQTHGRINHTAENIQTGALLITTPADGGLVGGLIGTAATAGMKTEIKTSVKLDDMKLADKSQNILWHDSISISNDVVVYHGESDSSAIFGHPDRALKEAVNEMIHRLGNSSLTNHTATSLGK